MTAVAEESAVEENDEHDDRRFSFDTSVRGVVLTTLLLILIYASAQVDQLGRLEGSRIGRTAFALLEQAHLAEQVTILHQGDHRLTAVEGSVGDRDAATDDDVEGARFIILAEEHIAALEFAAGPRGGDRRQACLVEVLEQRGARENVGVDRRGRVAFVVAIGNSETSAQAGVEVGGPSRKVPAAGIALWDGDLGGDLRRGCGAGGGWAKDAEGGRERGYAGLGDECAQYALYPRHSVRGASVPGDGT